MFVIPHASASPSATLALALLLVATGTGCGHNVAPMEKPSMTCTLTWTGASDLDLSIDGKSAFQLGGSPDCTQGGGSEAFIIPEDYPRETVVIGAINRSAEPGGSGQIDARAAITVSQHSGSSATMEHVMDSSPWQAFVVVPRSGAVTPIR